jgi:hypothetical protein
MSTVGFHFCQNEPNFCEMPVAPLGLVALDRYEQLAQTRRRRASHKL